VALRAAEAGGQAGGVTAAPTARPPRAAHNGGRNGRGARASDRAVTEQGGSARAGQDAPGAAGMAAPGAAPADDEPAGDEFDMATIADLENALRKVLNEGAGKGQPSWAATSASTYQASHAVHERIGQVAGIAHATREAIDGLDLRLSERQQQAITDAISARLLEVPPATLTDEEVQAIADAIAARLLDIPLGMVALDDASISRVGDEVADRVAGRLGPTVIRALREQFSRE
jgi:hypothetical protein